MRIVVTGGAGFIGTNLVRDLARDHTVTVVDDLSTGRAANLAGVDADRQWWSVLETERLARLVRGADAVVHLAARPSVPRSIEDPLATNRANVDGTLAVLEAARHADAPHLVVASSSSVYGANPVLPKHEDLPVAPLSPYAASKLASESYALAYASCYGLPVLTFRLFNVFGPFQPADHAYAAVLPRFIAAALAGRPLPVHGDGLQTRDFTYVGSVVRVIRDAVERQVTAPGPVNLAFGTRRSLSEVVAILAELVGHELGVEHQPPRPGDVRHSQADTGRLAALFPDVEPVPFVEGLAATVGWFRQTHQVGGEAARATS